MMVGCGPVSRAFARISEILMQRDAKVGGLNEVLDVLGELRNEAYEKGCRDAEDALSELENEGAEVRYARDCDG